MKHALGCWLSKGRLGTIVASRGSLEKDSRGGKHTLHLLSPLRATLCRSPAFQKRKGKGRDNKSNNKKTAIAAAMQTANEAQGEQELVWPGLEVTDPKLLAREVSDTQSCASRSTDDQLAAASTAQGSWYSDTEDLGESPTWAGKSSQPNDFCPKPSMQTQQPLQMPAQIQPAQMQPQQQIHQPQHMQQQQIVCMMPATSIHQTHHVPFMSVPGLSAPQGSLLQKDAMRKMKRVGVWEVLGMKLPL